MEGATAWEKFWKITFPTISPTLLVVIIYTIIDGFTDYGNKVMGNAPGFLHQQQLRVQCDHRRNLFRLYSRDYRADQLHPVPLGVYSSD